MTYSYSGGNDEIEVPHMRETESLVILREPRSYTWRMALVLLALTSLTQAVPLFAQIVPLGLSLGPGFEASPNFGFRPDIGAELLATAVGAGVTRSTAIAIGPKLWEYFIPSKSQGIDVLVGSILPMYVYAMRSLSPGERHQSVAFAKFGGNMWAAQSQYISAGLGIAKSFGFWSAKLELLWRREYYYRPADRIALSGALALGGWYEFGERSEAAPR